mgnify:CR=1 FL=1
MRAGINEIFIEFIFNSFIFFLIKDVHRMLMPFRNSSLKFSLSLSYFGSFVIFSFHIRFERILARNVFIFFLYIARASSQKREANKNSFVNTPTFYLYTYRSPSLFFELMKDAIVRGIITFGAFK